MSDEIIKKLSPYLPEGYEIDSKIGGGGQGSVFLGRFNGKKVAIKVMDDSHDPERVKREVDVLSSIQCDSLVSLIDSSICIIDGNEFPILAYEYYSEGDLRNLYLKPKRKLEENEIVKLGFQIGKALNALWEKRIVHRDIKPDNIVKSSEGNFVCVDIGFARHLNLESLTASGLSPGTRGYKSPEQAKGRKSLTIKSDIFSFGITLYELATLKHPFGGNQNLIGKECPVNLNSLEPDLSDRLVNYIHQMLSIRISERPREVESTFRAFMG